ncbi:hypothetical protein IEQ34_022195 [Dendrobium chrysotoxum]|uniref:Uncharacterized protein n=1 Tax=Dendrobium chrysotoxum TaxID=161865 RepID=A0AAV7FK12_DENCH|nr:hypothetical protein IEQ34_022195 [Dendrobium chrysotoxum]
MKFLAAYATEKPADISTVISDGNTRHRFLLRRNIRRNRRRQLSAGISSGYYAGTLAQKRRRFVKYIRRLSAGKAAGNISGGINTTEVGGKKFCTGFSALLWEQKKSHFRAIPPPPPLLAQGNPPESATSPSCKAPSTAVFEPAPVQTAGAYVTPSRPPVVPRGKSNIPLEGRVLYSIWVYNHEESKELEEEKTEELKIESIPLKVTCVYIRIRIRYKYSTQHESRGQLGICFICQPQLLKPILNNVHDHSKSKDRTHGFEAFRWFSWLPNPGRGPVTDRVVPEEKEGGPEDAVEAPEIRSVFEKGSSSGIPFTSKNQKKNYLRRVRRKIAKSRKIVEVKTLAQVDPEAVEDLPIPAFSPLLQGSHFHPLVAAPGEERVSRIASIPPRHIDYSTKRTP